jgi:hypothetical protein
MRFRANTSASLELRARSLSFALAKLCTFALGSGSSCRIAEGLTTLALSHSVFLAKTSASRHRFWRRQCPPSVPKKRWLRLLSLRPTARAFRQTSSSIGHCRNLSSRQRCCGSALTRDALVKFYCSCFVRLWHLADITRLSTRRRRYGPQSGHQPESAHASAFAPEWTFLRCAVTTRDMLVAYSCPRSHRLNAKSRPSNHLTG